MTHRKKNLSDDDQQVWKALSQAMVPLKNRGNTILPAPSPLPPRGITFQNDHLDPFQARRASLPGFRLPGETGPAVVPAVRHETQKPLEAGQLHTMDARTAERLRKGQTPIDRTLDLHGMTQAQAEKALEGFLRRSVQQNLRTVLIVTGKGYQTGETGILRQRLPDWLNRHPFREMVVGFTHAQPKDGGSGAFYVRLKRYRGL